MHQDYLITVRQAAEMLGVDEMTVRERLVRGDLGGVKQDSGLRRKWFVFREAVEQELAVKDVPPPPVEVVLLEDDLDTACLAFAPQTEECDEPGDLVDDAEADQETCLEILEHCDEEGLDATEQVDAEECEDPSHNRLYEIEKHRMRLLLDEAMEPFSNLLRRRDEELQAAVFRNGFLESELAMMREQTKLLPDLQARAQETEALKDKVKAMESELERCRTSWWYRLGAFFTGG